MRASDVSIGGKRVFVCGYGGAGNGSALAVRGSRASVVSAECDPVCASQACTVGFQVAFIESAVGEVDIFATIAQGGRVGLARGAPFATAESLEWEPPPALSASGSIMKKMRNAASAGNIGPFEHAIQMAEVEGLPGLQVANFKPQGNRFARLSASSKRTYVRRSEWW